MSTVDGTDLTQLTATELLDLYRKRATSPVEATQAVLERIDALNPTLNVFCLVDADTALASARESEARWRRGEPMGALDGVPTSIKDLILTRGWPTRRGSFTVDPDQPWDVDAPATARLREAGAVFVGKTTTPEFGCKGETNSPMTGITRNPWDPSKTSGGSSGGTAVAVAAGLAPLSIGSDGAGSVRIPAAFCGNFGFKGSFGRVPAHPLSPFGTVSHIGPHTMSVTDGALMMNVLKQPDARDWTALPPDPSDYLDGLDEGIAGLRVLFSPTLGYARVHPRSPTRLRRRPSSSKRSAPTSRRATLASTTRFRSRRGCGSPAAWTLWNNLTPAQQEVTDPDFAAEAQLGSELTNLEVQRLILRRGELGSMMRQLMQRYDLVVTPSVAVPAFEAKPAGHTPFNPESMLGWTPFSYPFNLTQQPACTIPCGLTSDGLPIGLQLVGPMFADALVLRAPRLRDDPPDPSPVDLTSPARSSGDNASRRHV